MKMAKIALCGLLFALCIAGVARASDDGDADFIIQEEILTEQLPESMLEIEELFLSSDALEDNLSAEGECGLACAITKFVQDNANGEESEAFYSNCPFHTNLECKIWRSKPHVRETAALPSRSIGKQNEEALRAGMGEGGSIDADAEYARPLLDRYKALMMSAQACCGEGMVHRLRVAGASQGLIYKFLVDDANFYGFGDRCLMMPDEELERRYRRTATASAVSNVRDVCLCRRREWFDALLAPFDKFSDAEFVYSYKDGLNRDTTVSVTDDVVLVKRVLSQCP